MPIQWKAKAAGEIVNRDWVIPVDDGDSVQSFTASAVGATIVASERSGNVVTLTISAGTNGATAIFTLDATTTKGLQIDETAYLPIRQTPNAFAYTVRNIVDYALRPIVGIGETAESDEAEDARETFDDMLAELFESGGDIGVKLPTDLNDTLYVSDAHISALKNGLRVRILEQYGQPISQSAYMAAQRGLQQVKMSLLPDERKSEFF